MKKKNKNKGGLGCSTVVQIVCIFLKLFNVVGWSWWVVFIPTYISILNSILGLVALLTVAVSHEK